MGDAEKKYLYIGSYTDESSKDGIYVYEFNTSINSLRRVSTSTLCKNPNFIDVCRNKLYSVNEDEERIWISLFQINKNANLNLLNELELQGAGPCHLQVYDGYLYYANYLSGEIGSIKLDEDGNLVGMPLERKHSGKGEHIRQDKAHPHGVHIWKERELLLVPDLGTDTLYAYTLGEDGLEEKLKVHVRAGDGPRHIAFHPNGESIYLICEITNTVYWYRWEDSRLIEKQRVSMIDQEGVAQHIAGEIEVTRNGKFVITSTRRWGDEKNEEGILCIFPLAENGRMKKPIKYGSGGSHPRMFSLTQDNKYLLVGNQYTNNLVIFKFDDETGKITQTNQVEVPNITCIVCDS